MRDAYFIALIVSPALHVGSRQVIDAVDSGHRGAQSGGVVKIPLQTLKAGIVLIRDNLAWISHKHPNAMSGLHQLPRQFAAYKSCRAQDKSSWRGQLGDFDRCRFASSGPFDRYMPRRG